MPLNHLDFYILDGTVSTLHHPDVSLQVKCTDCLSLLLFQGPYLCDDLLLWYPGIQLRRIILLLDL